MKNVLEVLGEGLLTACQKRKHAVTIASDIAFMHQEQTYLHIINELGLDITIFYTSEGDVGRFILEGVDYIV